MLLYVHIPYCRRKCLYCDFFSGRVTDSMWGQYTDAVIAEMRCRSNEITEPVTTLYIGGGTPSIMPIECLERLVSNLKAEVGQLWCVQEATIELNPDDVTPHYVDELLRIGFNRMSLGVQVLNDQLLHGIGRRHTAADAIMAMRTLRQRGVNLSVDLMFGLPQVGTGESACRMTVEIWRDTIERVVAERPDHISAYALMYEPGTALTALRDNGRITPLTDEEYELQYTMLTQRLQAAGYEHYEVSNYCLPGRRSRHNTSYWLGVPYIGLGPAAHPYDGKRTRRANHRDIKGYLAGRYEHDLETLDDEMVCDEYLLTRLRLLQGIDISDFESRFGALPTHRLVNTAGRLKGVRVADGRIAITPEAILTSDDIISTLAAALG